MGKNDRFEKIYSQGTMNVMEIWVDRETGVNYVFHASGYAGGMTPLLDRDGKPIDMRDISSRELKGHNILAVERFWDDTSWMIEFFVLRPSTAYGSPGEEMRLFLTEDGYQAALQSQQRREIKIKRYARVIEGHILDFKPGKRRRS